jgi:4-hydroxy-3-methylbut-2-enyl diphosphate reductase
VDICGIINVLAVSLEIEEASLAPMPVQRVILAAPRGFCAGVEMAIKALAWMVNNYPPPVYCYHEIVHNQRVVDAFRKRGVIFVDDIDKVPNGAPIMLSAHGSAPEVIEKARQSGGVVIDAVCPLVTKVHHELKVRASKGYEILYVGHSGHDEAIGTMAVAPSAVHLLQDESDVDQLPEISAPVALLAQTTLAHSEWENILQKSREQFTDVWMPEKSDLCFATTNRQAAVRELAPKVDAFVVLGSENSSNTRALERTAREFGTRNVIRANAVDEMPNNVEGIVAITAGASAPEELVQEIIDFLQPVEGVEEFHITDEDEYFPVPRELRDLASENEKSTVLDRSYTATQALADLAKS